MIRMLAGWRDLSTGISAVFCCLLFFWLLYSHPPKEGKFLALPLPFYFDVVLQERSLTHDYFQGYALWTIKCEQVLLVKFSLPSPQAPFLGIIGCSQKGNS